VDDRHPCRVAGELRIGGGQSDDHGRERDPGSAARSRAHGALFGDPVLLYQVSDEFGPLAGNDADHYFETHPTPGTSSPLRIWVLGDSGACGDEPAKCAVVQANKAAYLGFVGAERAGMLLFLGDNAYANGTEAMEIQQGTPAVIRSPGSARSRIKAQSTRSPDTDRRLGRMQRWGIIL
jgi:hypothetical protein